MFYILKEESKLAHGAVHVSDFFQLFILRWTLHAQLHLSPSTCLEASLEFSSTRRPYPYPLTHFLKRLVSSPPCRRPHDILLPCTVAVAGVSLWT
jgi:hypothetical protein